MSLSTRIHPAPYHIAIRISSHRFEIQSRPTAPTIHYPTQTQPTHPPAQPNATPLHPIHPTPHNPPGTHHPNELTPPRPASRPISHPTPPRLTSPRLLAPRLASPRSASPHTTPNHVLTPWSPFHLLTPSPRPAPLTRPLWPTPPHPATRTLDSSLSRCTQR